MALFSRGDDEHDLNSEKIFQIHRERMKKLVQDTEEQWVSNLTKEDIEWLQELKIGA
jgi:hypothetical protein